MSNLSFPSIEDNEEVEGNEVHEVSADEQPQDSEEESQVHAIKQRGKGVAAPNQSKRTRAETKKVGARNHLQSTVWDYFSKVTVPTAKPQARSLIKISQWDSSFLVVLIRESYYCSTRRSVREL